MSIIEITKENFKSQVLESDKPFLVDFWADWCGPCHLIAPIVEQIALENEGVMYVGKLNVDEQEELAYAYQIVSIPTLMLFVGGQVTAVISGAMPKAELMRQLSPHLTS
ncbi:MAG: thioredoxin [Coriobacteriia bacterium]|nr:thioredoxin [Coriobacteriia bacterium]